MAMTWEKLGEGFVTRREPGTPTAVAAGSRCALTGDGELVCTYMVQSKLGVNDFVPEPIPLPIAGSAEAPGPMTVLSRGRWVACYAPYNNYDPSVEVDRGQIVLMRSDDRGRTWSHTSMLRFAEPHSGGAEAWVVELADGRLLGTSWHMNLQDGSDYPCAYSLSADGGETWSPTRSTGIAGQTTALTALPDGTLLFLYCRRKGDAGIAMARVRPTENDFAVMAEEFVWRAERVRQSEGEADHSSWQEFAFGEPSAVLLPGGEVFVTFWTVQPAKQGIAYVRLKLIGEPN